VITPRANAGNNHLLFLPGLVEFIKSSAKTADNGLFAQQLH
jgi:hypothetical protein